MIFPAFVKHLLSARHTVLHGKEEALKKTGKKILSFQGTNDYNESWAIWDLRIRVEELFCSSSSKNQIVQQRACHMVSVH